MFVRIFIVSLFSGLFIMDGYAQEMPQKKKSLKKSAPLIYLDTSVNNHLFQESNLMILLDASGSMAGAKLYSAKKTIITLTDELKNTKTRVGLMAFNSGCTPAKLLIDPNNTDIVKVKKTIESIQSGGSTPLAVSIREAGRVINRSGKKTRLIVISDGGESCGGDPISEAKKLYNTTIDVIGFDVDSATEGSLSNIVSTGKGRYYSANDHDSLILSIFTILGKDITLNGITSNNKKNIVTDTRNKLMWQDVLKSGNWQDAIKECTYSDHAGYTDWRLPKIEEISTLHEMKHYDWFFKHAKTTEWSNYWSSTRDYRGDVGCSYSLSPDSFASCLENEKRYPSKDRAWAIVAPKHDTHGNEKTLLPKDISMYIQCVRDIQ